MKNIVKYLISVLAFAGCMVSCSKDPDVPINDKLDFARCLRPINFKCEVEYVAVTVKFTTFPDAEAYEIEAYSTDFLTLPEGEEPAVEDRVYSATINPENVPYTFEVPEEIECHIRIRAVNKTAGREPSAWVTGKVKTDVNPLTRCATPTNVKVEANYNWITCSLTPMANVKQYVMEIYSRAVPESGEPAPEYLLETVTKLPTEFPFTVKNVEAGTYYFRIQGRNEEAGLKPSKWVRGSYTTTDYTWLNIEGTFDYDLASGGKRETKLDKTVIPTQLPAKKVDTALGSTYTWDGVTYGPTCAFGDDKWSFNRCKAWDDKTYAKQLPLEAYEMLQVTQPGTLSFIPRTGSADESKMPEVVLAVLATRGDKVSFDYVYQEKLVSSSTITSKDEANRLNIDVPEEYLYGITEPATLYLFANLNTIIVYPLSYTRK